MKLECKVEEIKNAVSQVERITGKNLTLPVLNSILLIASNKSLKLRSTNLSLGVEVEIGAKVEKEGLVAISGSVLSGVFSNIFQNESISLEGVDGNLLIKSKKNDIKPEISSVFIYSNDDGLVFVSTDSFRLAEKKIKVKGLEEILGILIPFKNVGEILRIFGEHAGVVKVCFNKNQISFSSDNIYLTSRVIDGIFPDYRQIIPKDIKTTATILKQDLLNALKLSNIFSDKFNQVNLTINPKEKIFVLSSTNNDIGENKTYLDGAVTGENVELGFNYKYFLDCFSSISTDSLSIKLSGTSRPLVVSPVSDPSFTYLIMPISR